MNGELNFKRIIRIQKSLLALYETTKSDIKLLVSEIEHLDQQIVGMEKLISQETEALERLSGGSVPCGLFGESVKHYIPSIRKKITEIQVVRERKQRALNFEKLSLKEKATQLEMVTKKYEAMRYLESRNEEKHIFELNSVSESY